MPEIKTRLFPCSKDIPEIHFFRFVIVLDFLIFGPIFVMIPFNVICLILQKKYKTIENPFFFSYSVLRIFLFVMMMFIIFFQYAILLYRILKGIFEDNLYFLFIRYSIELIIFIMFFLWTFYLSYYFHLLVEKHNSLYSDVKSVGSDFEEEFKE